MIFFLIKPPFPLLSPSAKTPLMISDPDRDLLPLIRSNAPDPKKPLPAVRLELSAFYREMQEEAFSDGDYQVERANMKEGPACYWITLPGIPSDRVILFFHGGGFTTGSTDDHLGLCIRLARAANVQVLSVDYRLAPEHPFPSAIEDAVSAYRYLTGSGFHPHRILPVGISTGGTLVLSLLLSLRDKNYPLPLAGCCMSPMTSMIFEGESVTKNRNRDWMTIERLHAISTSYMTGRDLRDPLASPFFASMSGLPRLFVQAGTHELLASDIAAFVEKARWSGVPVQAEVWEGMFHCWQIFAGQISEGSEAVEHLGNFAREVLSR